METIRFKDKGYREIQPEQMPRGFAVIGCSLSISDCTGLFYELFFGDKVKCNTEIDELQAQTLIAEHNLTLVVDGVDGKIWA
ncbi:MAG: hypothetical protein SNH01_05800 [Rikenellaceae bacterium]